MGPIALALLKTGIPAILKYPILALTTYAGSNLIVCAYTMEEGLRPLAVA